jgi:hypothetical protein
MLVTEMFAPREPDLPTLANPGSSLCQERSRQLKSHYWFLIFGAIFQADGFSGCQ